MPYNKLKMQSSQYLNQMHTADKLAEEPWPEDATLYQVSKLTVIIQLTQK